jgi:uncharacterized membrane protein
LTVSNEEKRSTEHEGDASGAQDVISPPASSASPASVAQGPVEQPATGQPQQIAVAMAQFVGPLPPPAMLEHYNRVFPGCAERIIKMAEGQALHRQGLEQAVVQSKIDNERRGQWCAFVLGMTGVIGAVLLLAMGRDLAGFGIFVVSLGSLIGVFIVAQRTQAKELDEKRKNAQSVRTPVG